MEIKAELRKPFSEEQRCNFIVEQNHNKGYEIQETGEALLAVYNEPTIEEKQSQIRSVRNQYLADTDRFMIVDFPISKEEKANYKSYRQYLRDYTEQESWWESNPKTFEEWENN